MRFALISDIHSNAEALGAVLRDIEKRGIKRVLCLGDIVGYGPRPEECVDLVRERCDFSLMGNHDKALFQGAARFNPYARGAIDWTRERLEPTRWGVKKKVKTDRWGYLQKLEVRVNEKDLAFVHGSPRDPINEYVYREDIYFNDGKLREIFSMFERLLFVGHTHLPMVLASDMTFHGPESMSAAKDEEDVRLAPDKKYIINVGSVGQPRDRDCRACYVEFDDDVVRFHRVTYDIETVIAQINEIRALDAVLGTRLRDGM